MSFLDRVDSAAKKIESFLSGGAAADPLYITNRSLGQKVRLGLLIGTPVLTMGVLMALALNSYFDPDPSTQKAPTVTQKAGERTAKVLPNIEKGFTTDYSRDVDILEAAVSRSADRTLAGKVRNNTDHIVRSTDIVFDVTDEDGSQLGGVAVRIENLAPRSIAPFKVALEQREATAAMVREVHSR
jgi:hypothetical protein